MCFENHTLKELSINVPSPYNPRDQPPPTSRLIVQGDQSLRIIVIVKGDHFPKTLFKWQRYKKNHSIPLHPNALSRGINLPTPKVLAQVDESPKTLQKRLNYDEKSFNHPTPKNLVQVHQSSNTQSPSPGGSIPQNFAKKG